MILKRDEKGTIHHEDQDSLQLYIKTSKYEKEFIVYI